MFVRLQVDTHPVSGVAVSNLVQYLFPIRNMRGQIVFAIRDKDVEHVQRGTPRYERGQHGGDCTGPAADVPAQFPDIF